MKPLVTEEDILATVSDRVYPEGYTMVEIIQRLDGKSISHVELVVHRMAAAGRLRRWPSGRGSAKLFAAPEIP